MDFFLSPLANIPIETITNPGSGLIQSLLRMKNDQ
jgi:hypothetical protein